MSVILLLGCTGMLGQSMKNHLEDTGGNTIIGVARQGGDIQIDISDVKALCDLLHEVAPERVINCAALANIDECETDKYGAWATNARPLQVLADWSQMNKKPLMHISTDHFYSGDSSKPHKENDDVFLLHEYSKSKYASELFALKSDYALVIRTSIVGFRGWSKPTFFEWAWDVVEFDSEATLYSDAFTSSIDAYSFAELSLDLFLRGATGIYNVASREVYSKEDFIKELAKQRNKPLTRTISGSIKESSVKRGDSLGLAVNKAGKLLGVSMPSLKEVVARLIKQKVS